MLRRPNAMIEFNCSVLLLQMTFRSIVQLRGHLELHCNYEVTVLDEPHRTAYIPCCPMPLNDRNKYIGVS